MTASSGTVPVSAWVTAARLPFTTVAVVPFMAGVYIAFSNGQQISWAASAAGTFAVLLICIGCYMLGEVFDQAEDRKTRDVGRTPFSGGTLLVADGILEAGNVKIAAIACFAVAACLGILITVIQKAPWLLALGLFGGFSAAFYSTPPIRLVKRGFGEIFIGICYGWLPLVTGYGTATGSMPPQSWLYFWPVALTVFNIILINEFPDHVPDSTSGKRNFLVRVGMKTGSIVYALASVAAGVMLLVIWFHYRGESLNHLLITLPAAALSFVLAGMAAFTRKWESPSTIGPLCGMTIVLNLVSAVTVAVLVRW